MCSARAAVASPDGTALVSGETTYTFAVLHGRVSVPRPCRRADRARRAASPSSATTIPRGSRRYYAVPAVGRVLVFGNHRLASAELRSVIERSGTIVVIGPRAELDRIVDDEPLPGVERTVDLDEWDAALAGTAPSCAHRERLRRRRRGSSTRAARPDGRRARRSPTRNVLAAVRITNECRIVPDDERYLLPFPLSHIAGYNVIHHHARAPPRGADAPVRRAGVRRDRRPSRDHARRRLRPRCSTASSRCSTRSPTWCRQLGSLRLIAYGAAPMPVPLLRRGHDAPRRRLHLRASG